MTNKILYVGEVPWLRELRANVIELLELHRTAGNTLARSDAVVRSFGHTFLYTWKVLMQKSFVSCYPTGLQEFWEWMANTAEYQKFGRPHLARILACLDFFIDPPKKASSQKLVLRDQLPSCTCSYEQLKPQLVYKRSLSSGASCETFLFRDNGKYLVCKLGKREDWSMLQAFWREALLLDYLRGAGGSPALHANCSDRPCLFLSCVEGKTLSRAYSCLSARGLVEVFLALARSLQDVHKAGVLHNDIKADNVIVKIPMAGLGKVRAALIDFGLGALVDEVAHTRNHNVINYIQYMWYAPEVFFNRGASFASDIFSLGMMLERLVVKQMKAGRLSAWPEGLEELVADMVEYKEEDRPTITEVITRLTAILPGLLYLQRSLEGFPDSDDESDDESDEDDSDEDDSDEDESGEDDSDEDESGEDEGESDEDDSDEDESGEDRGESDKESDESKYDINGVD